MHEELSETLQPDENRYPGKRVIICEDHPLVREMLRNICVNLGCEVIAETATGEEAVELVDFHVPDLLILDQRLGGVLDGRAVHSQVRQRKLRTKVIVVTSYCDSASFFEWVNQPDGPDGVLPKTSSVYQIREGIRRVITSSVKYIPSSVWDRELGSPLNPLRKLSPSELYVLRCIADGQDYATIAKNRGWTITTARSHMWDVYEKLDLPSNTMHSAAAVYTRWVNAPGITPQQDLDDTELFKG